MAQKKKPCETRCTRHCSTASSPPKLSPPPEKPSSLHRETETPPEQESGSLNSSSSPGLVVTESFVGPIPRSHPEPPKSTSSSLALPPQRNHKIRQDPTRSETKSPPGHHRNRESST
ncbi:hypothetical protein Rs2_13584 [Raphanus sativus]|nr:hypothetical protein Rs2_13584 [Raphanus sativus]